MVFRELSRNPELASYLLVKLSYFKIITTHGPFSDPTQGQGYKIKLTRKKDKYEEEEASRVVESIIKKMSTPKYQ